MYKRTLMVFAYFFVPPEYCIVSIVSRKGTTVCLPACRYNICSVKLPKVKLMVGDAEIKRPS